METVPPAACRRVELSVYAKEEQAMYENNFDTLEQIVRERAVIRHVSRHRKPDGSFDLEGNLKLWNDAIARFEQIPLWEGGAPGFDAEKTPLQPEPSIIFVPARGTEEPRGTIIVAHGGGFTSRTGCEGMNVAWYFANRGFSTAILTYRLMPYSRYDSMHDMQRAIRLLRMKRTELAITDKVAVMGFSAGGMLCGNCATHFDGGDASAADPVERESCRPDAAVIAYGAFAFSAFPQPFNPMRKKTPVRETFYFAPEANVTPDTPPCFVWQTNSDDARHSFAFCSAMTAAGAPFELHCFPQGVHGLALADGENDLDMNLPHVAKWAELCTEWLREQGI